MGRTVDDPELADLAPGYAQWQLRRPWMRYFWFWFVPGIFIVLGVAAQIHPILVGVTIALGAQAVWANISLRKTAAGRYVDIAADSPLDSRKHVTDASPRFDLEPERTDPPPQPRQVDAQRALARLRVVPAGFEEVVVGDDLAEACQQNGRETLLGRRQRRADIAVPELPERVESRRGAVHFAAGRQGREPSAQIGGLERGGGSSLRGSSRDGGGGAVAASSTSNRGRPSRASVARSSSCAGHCSTATSRLNSATTSNAAVSMGPTVENRRCVSVRKRVSV